MSSTTTTTLPHTNGSNLSTHTSTSTPATSTTSTPPTKFPPLETTTLLIAPSALSTSPHMPALFNLINATFSAGHNSLGRSLLPPIEYSRLRTYEQLGIEIGDDGFTYLMFSVPNEKVIGTASSKPYLGPKVDDTEKKGGKSGASDATALFKRQPGTEKELAEHAGLPKWEILVTVVDVKLQGRGLAQQLMDITIGEIRRRVAAQQRGTAREGDKIEESEGSRGQILLLLSTMQELNEGYYAKRGWTTTGLRRFEKGTMGSRDGFGVVEMMRVIEG